MRAAARQLGEAAQQLAASLHEAQDRMWEAVHHQISHSEQRMVYNALFALDHLIIWQLVRGFRRGLVLSTCPAGADCRAGRRFQCTCGYTFAVDGCGAQTYTQSTRCPDCNRLIGGGAGVRTRAAVFERDMVAAGGLG